MSVPKCKDCQCIWNVPVKDYSKKEYHYCHWWCMSDFHGNGGKINIYKTGFHGSDGKIIKSKEYQTSPKWCPIRKEEEKLAEEQAERFINKFNSSLFLKHR